MPTDRELVLMHLRKYGSITQEEAKAAYGCARLAPRINELRKKGYAIETEMVAGKRKHGRVTSYARYRLSEVAE